MCSLSSYRLENWLRAHLLNHVSLLDEATKRATTAFNILLFFNIESTPGSVLLDPVFFCVYALSPQTHSWLWQIVAHTEPGSAGGFFLLKGSFPFCCTAKSTTHFQVE
ncbi:hypothetical protein AMECASPLE_013197 [Ameca splendens]|uniref:Uncharacterized protein n=1 Tax=Ameca splendens TaxID=208324 RepID=A0ABV0YD43_9TELE